MGFTDDIRKAGHDAIEKAKDAMSGDKDAPEAETPPQGDAAHDDPSFTEAVRKAGQDAEAGAPHDDPSFTEALRKAGQDAQAGGADTAEAPAETPPPLPAEPAAEPAAQAPTPPPTAAPAPPRPREQHPAAKAAPKAAPSRGGAVPAPKRQAEAPKRRTYTVKSGDTLSAIGQRFGVDWRDIAKVNKIPNPDLIYPGQTFVIPDK